MRYTAAYLLAVLGGNSSPDVAAIAKILDSVGIECDEKRAQKVIDACHGRNVEDIIAKGMEKIDNTPMSNTSMATPMASIGEVSDPTTKPVGKGGNDKDPNDSPPSSPGSDTGGGMFDLFG